MASILAYAILVICTVGLIGTIDGASSGVCSNNPKGLCLKLDTYYCNIGYSIAHSGCGYKEVCCSPFVKSKPKFEYGKDQCGVSGRNSNSKIVGGKDTSILYYPWTVSIQKYDSPVCGGSIISDQWVLTAAHCVTSDASGITVVAGSTSSHLSLSRYYKRHQVQRILFHSQFTPGRAANGYDIAMIKLSKPLDTTGYLTRKVCLPDTGEKFDNRICVATGWGYTKEPPPHTVAVSSGGSPKLRQANLPVWKKSLCKYYLGKIKSHHICAGYKTGGEDTCQGDSGGPLVCQDEKGFWKQAGIVSVGTGCARSRSMGIYTEVAAFRQWIDYVIKTM